MSETNYVPAVKYGVVGLEFSDGVSSVFVPEDGEIKRIATENTRLRCALEKAAHETADYGECPAGATAWRIKDCKGCDVDEGWNVKKREKCWLQYFMEAE